MSLLLAGVAIPLAMICQAIAWIGRAIGATVRITGRLIANGCRVVVTIGSAAIAFAAASAVLTVVSVLRILRLLRSPLDIIVRFLGRIGATFMALLLVVGTPFVWAWRRVRRPVVWVVAVCGRAARGAFSLLFRALGRFAALGAAAFAIAVLPLRLSLAGMAWFGRRGLVPAARAAWRAAIAGCHVVRSAAGWSVRWVVAPIARAIRRAVVAAARVVAGGVGWSVRWVVAPVARAIRWTVEAAVRVVAGGVGWSVQWVVAPIVGSAGAIALSVLGAARAVVVRFAVGLRRVVALVVIAIIASPARRLLRMVWSFSRPVRRVLRQVWSRTSELIIEVGEELRRGFRGAAQATLVAAGTARHRASMARLAARPGEPAWLAPEARRLLEGHGLVDDRSPAFTIEISQNEFVPAGDARLTAVVTVSGAPRDSAAHVAEVVEVLMIDCSASMGQPWEKVRSARRATLAAVEALRDGVWFAVIRGTESAEVVYPRREGLVRATADSRRAAARVIRTLQPVGGTAMGTWLRVTRDLMSLRPNSIHHAILLTDGKDEDETEADLDAALAACRGKFQCDCRGVGTDWDVNELRKVSSALVGSLDIIAEPVLMEREFVTMMATAMSRQVEGVLRVWVPAGARLHSVRQVSPAIVDLLGSGRARGPLVADCSTGGWADEQRAYLLSVDLAPAPAGSEMLAARVSLVAGNRVLVKGLVKATRTDVQERFAPMDPVVAHYIGQEELARLIQEGLQARRAADDLTAARKLGQAVQVAERSGHDRAAELLGAVVEVDDPVTGHIRLRDDVTVADEMTLDSRSTRTVRAHRAGSPPDPELRRIYPRSTGTPDDDPMVESNTVESRTGLMSGPREGHR